MTSLRIAVIALLGLGACGYSGPYEDPLERLDRMDGPSFVEIGEVRARADGMTFFCSGVDGLNVVDATNPGHMTREASVRSGLGSARFPRCQHVALSGDRVYMSNRGDGVQGVSFVEAYDTKLRPPQSRGAFQPVEGSIEGIAATDALVLAAMHDDGLAILDVSNMQPISITGGLVNAWGVAVSGSFAYVADGVGGVAVVDITDPESAPIVGRVETGGAAQSIDVHDGFAYVAAGQAGLVIVDVSNPTQPVVVARVDTPGTAVQVTVDENIAVVADWNDVRVYDVSDPTAPRIIGSKRVSTGNKATRVLGADIANGVVFVGEWTGLYSYRLHPERTAPDLWVAERNVDLGNVPKHALVARAIIVENHGSAPLSISSIRVVPYAPLPSPPSGAYTVSPASLSIPPGGRGVFDIGFRSLSGTTSNATVIIESDDPDAWKHRIPISANSKRLGIGDESPDVRGTLIDGTPWDLADHHGKVVLLSYFATF